MIWNEIHQDAFENIVITLNKSGMKWLIFRNYQGLPQKNFSKDIDIVIERKNFKKTHELINKEMLKKGFTKKVFSKYQNAWCTTYLKESDNKIYSFTLDLMDGFMWKGALIQGIDQLYPKSIKYKNFRVPNKIQDSLSLYLKPLISGNFIKEKYKEEILSTVKSKSNEFRDALNEIIKDKELCINLCNLIKENKFEETLKFRKKIVFLAWLYSFKKNPIKTLRNNVMHNFIELIRRVKKLEPENLVAVVGPDGVGKSTFINLLHKKSSLFLNKDLNRIKVLHFRPNLFPNLGAMVEKVKIAKQDKNFENPHRGKPKPFFSSLTRIIYYWLDYILGYILVLKKEPHITDTFIFDRYFYDFISDPARSSIKLPLFIRELFLKLTPEPGIVFFLNCDAEIIYKRKQELEIIKIEEILLAYQNLSKKNKRFRILDANRTPEELVDEAIKLWFRRLKDI